MMALLHLVRHGAHDDLGIRLTGRGPDKALNAEGRRQVLALAGALAAMRPDRIETSPRGRCRETAGLIAAAAGLSPVNEGRLDEIDFGDWTGKPFAELDPQPEWQAWNACRAAARPPDGESMGEAQARIVGRIEALARGGGKSCVLVSHQDVIKAAILFYRGESLDRHAAFAIRPASVSTLVFGANGITVEAVDRAGP